MTIDEYYSLLLLPTQYTPVCFFVDANIIESFSRAREFTEIIIGICTHYFTGYSCHQTLVGRRQFVKVMNIIFVIIVIIIILFDTVQKKNFYICAIGC